MLCVDDTIRHVLLESVLVVAVLLKSGEKKSCCCGCLHTPIITFLCKGMKSEPPFLPFDRKKMPKWEELEIKCVEISSSYEMALFYMVKNKCLIFQGDKAELADFGKFLEC